MKATLIIVLKTGIEVPVESEYPFADKEDIEMAIHNSKNYFYQAKRNNEPTFWCLGNDVSTDEVLFIKCAD